MTTTHRNRLLTAISNTPGAAGALTISAASSGYRTFSAGDDGLSFDVSIVDGTSWEIRTGCVYTHAGTSLSRGALEDSSTGSAITLTSAAVVTVTMTAWLGNALETTMQGEISGLELTWNSATSISVGTGFAQIESTGRPLYFTSTVTASGLSLSAATWYHVYVYNNAGTPAIEVVTTAPAAAYVGSARSKTGDTTRRYVASIRAGAGGSVLKFQHDSDSGLVAYRLAADSAVYRVLSAGAATTSTSVSMSALLPATSTLALLKVSNTDAALSWVIAHGDETADQVTSVGYFGINAAVRSVFPMPTNTSQAVTYDWSATPTGGAFIDVLGYWFKR